MADPVLEFLEREEAELAGIEDDFAALGTPTDAQSPPGKRATGYTTCCRQRAIAK